MKNFIKIYLLFIAISITSGFAMNKEDFGLICKNVYTIDTGFWCISSIEIKNKILLVLINTNTIFAKAYYTTNNLNSTATLKKVRTWWYNKEIRGIFIPRIIEHIQNEHPHIKKLECPERNTVWIFK